MSSSQRKKLKKKVLGIEVRSGIPNQEYDRLEVSELIYIAKYFTELREKNKKKL